MAARRKSPSKKTVGSKANKKAASSKRRATTSASKSARAKVKTKAVAKSPTRPAARPAVKSAARAKATRKAPASSRPAPAPLYRTLTPFLTIGGDAEEALAFYKEAFGARERARMPGPDGKIMHAEILIGDSVLMLSDAIRQPPSQSTLHLYVDDCDAVYERALQAGATEKMPMQDMFWGDRYGMVVDPFGNNWSIATHKEDIEPEEMARRMEAAMPPESSNESLS